MATAPVEAPPAARQLTAWIPCSTAEVASARLRAILPAAYMRRAGWRAELGHRGERRRRDCVVFQKPYGPGDLEWAERLSKRRVKVVVDLCDNFLHAAEAHPDQAKRARRLRRMVDLADAVTVSTASLAEVVDRERVFVVEDAFDVPAQGPFAGELPPIRSSPIEGPLRLVWFGNSGSPAESFGVHFLADVLPDIAAVHRRRPVELTVISNSRSRFDAMAASAGFPCRYVEWTLGGFARTFVTHHVCLLPLEPNAITLHKSANRLLLSLSLGVPVVADRIPSYEAMADWVLFADWERSIEAYASDADLRVGHLAGAREHIERTYTPDRVVQQWGQALSAVLGH